mgnify:CR=1 FL=1
MRKKLVLGIAVLVVLIPLLGVGAFYGAGGIDGLQQSTVAHLLDQQRTDLFEDDRMHVFTLGTGSPQTGTGRLPAANAVIAGDQLILIDAGEGASRTLGDLNIPLQRLTAVFLTHWHSDHIAGVGQMLNQSWNADRNHEVLLFGPEGVADFVDALRAQYAEDIRYRSLGHVENNDPDFALATAVPVEIGEETLPAVYEQDGLIVKAFSVDHGHVKPAFGYRVEYQGRVVVFSGDTVVTPLMLEPARGADVLVHEAINVRMIENAAAALESAGLPVEADRARGIIGYHADTIELARLAEETGVKLLVLTHLIPGPPNAVAKWMFTLGRSDAYSGEIRIAYDGDEIIF